MPEPSAVPTKINLLPVKTSNGSTVKRSSSKSNLFSEPTVAVSKTRKVDASAADNKQKELTKLDDRSGARDEKKAAPAAKQERKEASINGVDKVPTGYAKQ